MLVHLGAQTTVVVILLAGQGAFATSFQMGGDFFTRSLARLRNSSEETAETLKRTKDLLNGREAMPDFVGVVDGWVAELKRQLNEWFEHNPGAAPEASSFELSASGGGFDQPGLLAYLKAEGLELRPWPKGSQPDAVSPSKQFEVAFGASLQALGYSAQPVSLLPDDYRVAWSKRLSRQRIEIASVALALICVLVLALGSWRQISIFNHKDALLKKVQAAQEAAEANDALTGELSAEYEGFRPLFARQQNTVDTLKLLALLERSRSNRSFWYVVLADQQSYFSYPPAVTATNNAGRTNVPVTLPHPGIAFATPAAGSTNLSPAKPGFIAELCIPEDAESARRTLGQLVNGLKEQALFSKVDLLSDDLRRNLADPKVVIPDRRFVLAMDFAETEFQQPPPPRKIPAGGTARPIQRRASRPGWTTPESADSFTQTTP